MKFLRSALATAIVLALVAVPGRHEARRPGQGHHQDRDPEPAQRRPGRARRGHQARHPARRREVQGHPREAGLQGRAGAVRRPGQARRRRGQRQEHHRRQGHPGRHRPPELRRGHPVVGGLQGSQPGDDLARQHQPHRHRPRLPERQPGVRARRRAGRGGLGVRARDAEGQDGLHHPRQDHLRAGRGRVLQGRRREEGHQGPRLRGHRGEVELRSRSSPRSRPRTPTSSTSAASTSRRRRSSSRRARRASRPSSSAPTASTPPT